jgi:hypothetical protein
MANPVQNSAVLFQVKRKVSALHPPDEPVDELFDDELTGQQKLSVHTYRIARASRALQQ